MPPTRLAIHGAAGRMGQRLVALAHEDPGLTLVAAIEHAGHDRLGDDAGEIAQAGAVGVPLTDRLDTDADALIDFSTPDAAARAAAWCHERRVALVVGTTGLDAPANAAIDAAASAVPVLAAPNMSLGVNLLFAVAAEVAARLGDGYDIEIVEAHHRFKQDAPSGTALGLARSICEATGRRLESDLKHGRSGQDPRTGREIGMHALRMGDVVGEHSVHLAGLGERIELRHTAQTRDIFVRGALKVAAWLAGKPAGRYRMADVLGLGG